MSEERPNIIEMFSYIFKFLFTLTVIYIIIVLSLNLKVEIDLKSTERLSSDTAENYASLAYYKNVFDKTELQKLNNTLTELVSDCAIGSHVKITNLKDGSEYEFGYSEGIVKSSMVVKRKYNTAIRLDSKLKNFYYDTVEPASMEIDLFRTSLTEISCIVRKSFDNKIEHNMTVTCIESAIDGKCIFPMEYLPNKLCFYSDNLFGGRTYPDCREMKINTRIGFGKNGVGFNNENKAFLRAIPLKQRSGISIDSPCESYDLLRAGLTDNIEEVVLCMQEL